MNVVRPLAVAVVAAGIGLVSAACGTPQEFPQTVFEPRSEFAKIIDDLFRILLFGAIVVFVVVQALLLIAALRFRRRAGDPLPKQIHGNSRLELAWTIAPAVVLGVILIPSTQAIFETQAPAPENALQVQVTGRQFWWEFYYPQFELYTANEVYLPVGQTANFQEESADVIHSFWIPALGGKRDVVPGHKNFLWMTPNTIGTFLGQCAELCGASHANMRMRAMVRSPQEFQAWVNEQRQPAQAPPAGSDAEKGAQLFAQRGCGGCHTIGGRADAVGRTGPNLTHVADRTTIAAGVLDNTADDLRTWLKDPPGVKPGALMPNLNLSDEDITSLIAYLQFLK